MKTFNIKTCPLCGNPIIINYRVSSADNTAYKCSASSPCHYVVDVNFYDVRQMFYIENYLIVNTAGTNKSIIYEFECSMMEDPPHTFTDNIIMELPMITPEDPEKLLKRIKLLIPFS